MVRPGRPLASWWSAALTLVLLGAPMVAGQPSVDAAAVPCVSWCGGGEYHELPATRLLESASRPTGPKGPSFDLPLLGRSEEHTSELQSH